MTKPMRAHLTGRVGGGDVSKLCISELPFASALVADKLPTWIAATPASVELASRSRHSIRGAPIHCAIRNRVSRSPDRHEASISVASAPCANLPDCFGQPIGVSRPLIRRVSWSSLRSGVAGSAGRRRSAPRRTASPLCRSPRPIPPPPMQACGLTASGRAVGRAAPTPPEVLPLLCPACGGDMKSVSLSPYPPPWRASFCISSCRILLPR